MLIALDNIRAAAGRITHRIEHTAIVASPSLSDVAGVPVYLKLESRQITGSFKLRGATNAILRLGKAASRGVIAASTGNHGRALAHAAKLEDIPAVICMSKLVPANKVDEIRRLGADVRIIGSSQDDAQREVDRLVEAEGFVMIPPFDHADVIAGQGTLGLEIVEAIPDVATVLVPLSGGGLAAGVASAVKALKPRARIVGVSMARGAAMKASLDAGKPVEIEELPTLADSLGGGIGLDNLLTFKICRELLDDVVLVSEAEIAHGIRHLYAHEREVAEGAGAVGIAAILARKATSKGPVVALVSGKNIDMEVHGRIVCGEQTEFERLDAGQRGRAA